MSFVYLENAEKALIGLANFVDEINVPGSGYAFLKRFIAKIESNINPKVKYKLCNHKPFALRGYSCVYINGWVIAFTIQSNNIVVVHEVVIGKLLY